MKTRFAIAVALLVTGSAAMAQRPIDPCVSLNLRPTPIWGEFGTDLSLQDVVDDMTMFGPRINTQGAQSRDALFQQRPASVVVLTFAYDRFFGEGQYLGIYEAGNPANKILVFAGGLTRHGDKAVLEFKRNGDVFLNGRLAARNFDNCFGLYSQVYGGTPLAGGSGDPNVLDWTFYSEDARNLHGDGQMVALRGYGKCVFKIPNTEPFWFEKDQFLVGLENLPCTALAPQFVPADRDYNDAVVLLSGVQTYRQWVPYEN